METESLSKSKLLQSNLNRSRQAQDYMFKGLVERTIIPAVAAVLYRVLDESQAAGD
jgi:hypothetical protein